MTCIVAIKDRESGRVVMACDSQASNNGTVMVCGPGKIVDRDGFLFGAAGPLWIGNFYRYDALPTWPQECCPTLAAWCVLHLAQYLQREATRGNRWRDGSLGSKELGGETLVARGGELVMMDGVGGVVFPSQGWWAIGSGAQEARGVLNYAAATDPAEYVARHAVEAAIALDDGCCGPVNIAWTVEREERGA